MVKKLNNILCIEYVIYSNYVFFLKSDDPKFVYRSLYNIQLNDHVRRIYFGVAGYVNYRFS